VHFLRPLRREHTSWTLSELRRRIAGAPAPSGGKIGGLPRLDRAGRQAARLRSKPRLTLTSKKIERSSIQAQILALLQERDATASACPSEIARKLAGADEWRTLMPEIRDALGELSDVGLVLVTRGTEELNASQFGGGPIRFRRGRRYAQWLVSHGHDD
jgi:transposase